MYFTDDSKPKIQYENKLYEEAFSLALLFPPFSPVRDIILVVVYEMSKIQEPQTLGKYCSIIENCMVPPHLYETNQTKTSVQYILE